MLRKNMQSYHSVITECLYNVVTMTLWFIYNRIKTRNNFTYKLNKTRLYVDQHSSSELLGLLYTAIGFGH